QPKGEHFAHPLRRLHHLARLGGGHRRRFFTKDVAPRLQRGDGRRRVKPVGGADAHRVQLFFFQHLLVVLISPAKAKAFGHLFGPLIVDVRAGDQLHLIASRLIARNVGRLRDASDSDDPDSQFGHKKRSLRLVLRRNRVLCAKRGPASCLALSSQSKARKARMTYSETTRTSLSVGSSRPWTGKPAAMCSPMYSRTAAVIRSPGKSKGMPGG